MMSDSMYADCEKTSARRRRGGSARRLAAACAIALGLALAAACGSSKSPTSPTTPAADAPTPLSPLGDALVDLRPTLTLQNVSGASGTVTYEFQVSTDNQFGSGTIDKSGVSQGSNGQTEYALQQDLKSKQRYYWHARADMDGTEGHWSPAATFQTPGEPVLQGLVTSSERVEVGKSIKVTAPVVDAETSGAQIEYDWTADGGTFSGSGATVKWTAPTGKDTPAKYTLKVKVTEQYTVQTATGPQSKTTTTSGDALVYVNDSPTEISDLVLEFLGRFSNSAVSPETCVSTFSDNCPGKAEELAQIQGNRADYSDIIAEHFSIGSISLNGDKTRANIEAPCGWTSVYRNPTPGGPTSETVDGTCLLTTVYEDHEWKLCDSNFHGHEALKP